MMLNTFTAFCFQLKTRQAWRQWNIHANSLSKLKLKSHEQQLRIFRWKELFWEKNFLINCITFTFCSQPIPPEWLWIYDTLGCVCRAEQQIFDRKAKGTRTVNAILITVIIQMVVPYLFHSNRRPLETFISIQEGASETAAAGSTVYREQGNKYQLHIRSAFVSRRAQIFIGSWKMLFRSETIKTAANVFT